MREPITLVGEGATDIAVARRLLVDAGLHAGPEYSTGGKQGLDRNLRGFNNAARFSCWLVLRDLDLDADCAPALRISLLETPAPRMRLHLAVNAIESWLLADRDGFATFFAVPPARVPGEPERVRDPKQEVVNLGRTSRRREVREALVPIDGSSAKIGRGYTTKLIEFAQRAWNPAAAEVRSESLGRLRTFLRGVSAGIRPCG